MCETSVRPSIKELIITNETERSSNLKKMIVPFHRFLFFSFFFDLLTDAPNSVQMRNPRTTKMSFKERKIENLKEEKKLMMKHAHNRLVKAN